MPRLSVVVPIYNVEGFLEECLGSLAGQTFADLEVVMVNDGSTDGSAAIAEAFAARDERFRLITQPNGGLSAARNTGLDAATGEFLAFVDSDDVLPPDAYERMVGALDQTGSDFATGNVHRLSSGGLSQARFLRRAFSETRLKTHVTEYPHLIADRTAWNKVFRRAFWDRQGYRFPVGVINEDIPVMVPAHFSARSVDVISDPVYYWRIRDSGDLSITERRLEIKALTDRLDACESVSEHLERHGPRKSKRWYDESLVADDLRLYLNLFDRASEEWQALFLDRVNALLDRADDGIYDKLEAIDRLKWHLVRRRMVPELNEVLRFWREDLADTPPVKVRGRWYGDYPFRGDPRRRIPDRIYRLNQELTFTARIDEIREEGGRLLIRGLAFIDGIGAPAKGSQRVSVSAVRPGRLRRLRLLTTPVRFKTRTVHRPDANAVVRHQHADVSWSGFEARLHPRRLQLGGRLREGTWELYVTARVGRLGRRRVRFFRNEVRPTATVTLPSAAGMKVRAVPTPEWQVLLEARTSWAALRGHRLTDDGLELTGELHGVADGELKLELRGGDGSATLRRPVTVTDGGSGFSAVVPLQRLVRAIREPDAHVDDEDDDASDDGDEEEGGPVWELFIVGGGKRLRVMLPDDVDEPRWPVEDRELAVFGTRQGEASLALRAPHAVLTEAGWTPDGALEVAGLAPGWSDARELVLVSVHRGVKHAFPLELEADGAGFRARVTPAAIPTLGGPLPLSDGRWRLCTRPAGNWSEAALVPVMVAADLRARLPFSITVDHKPFHLGLSIDNRAVLIAQLNLDSDERGPYNQRRLRETAYVARRREPLLDTVVYTSFRGRQYSDNPRAIHEELVRRELPLEHLWIVRDGAAAVPPTARVLREGSREAYEALARTRFFVTNDHFPEWFHRHDDQVCLQTWHGTPLKRLGFDVSRLRGSVRKFERNWTEHVHNWQYVLSPSRFATPIFQQAYALESAVMLETGYPRTDVLAGAQREAASRRLRERLGIPDGVRTILYAPTFRDHVRDSRGRYRLDFRLDLERLRAAAGPDTLLLVRKHHYVIDAVPGTDGEFVRDVSTFPDATELLLAADVLITDYSSMIAEYANTGRPMLFFTYDLDAYEDEIRGFYVDFEETVPGPLLRTSDEVADALRDLDAVQAAHADRYSAFVERFCEFDDGSAAARVVDRLFTV